MINVKRVYDSPSSDDGYRVLVDRLWPRGLSKDAAALDLWCKDVAPSRELRTWHHVDVEGRFDEFAERYAVELDANPATDELRTIVDSHPTVTLLFGSKDPRRNNATVLADFLRAR